MTATSQHLTAHDEQNTPGEKVPMNAAPNVRLDSVEEAIADIAAGRAVVVVDDEDRENEGDLVFAASKSTPRADGLHHPLLLRRDLRADDCLDPRPARHPADDPAQP